MLKRTPIKYISILSLFFILSACKIPAVTQKKENKLTPAGYTSSQDTANSAKMTWKEYFNDPFLSALIDTALRNNQELNITLQEIEIARNEIRIRKGEYLPFIGLKAGGGVDKVARYTSRGASEANIDIKPGKATPEPLGDMLIGVYANWEVDVWKKLRNAKKAAVNRYLATVEGKNFVVTNLIAEIANAYYELLALDNQLEIVQQNINIQNNALKIVRLQKESAKVTELAVKRFEAEVLNTQSIQYNIQQQIIETENKINFLLARYPQTVPRKHQDFEHSATKIINAGIPSQLLENRPDIRAAEQELSAAKLDVAVARARFYPSLGISASLGYQAFNPAHFLKTPESVLYSLAGDIAAPLVNRNAIKAEYQNANAKQIQAVYEYERKLLNAYVEVVNQLSKINNLEKSYGFKSRQVEALTQSITISGNLFTSARADYMEVLLTQRDALESKFDLIETKLQQMSAMVNIYRALGGGWE